MRRNGYYWSIVTALVLVLGLLLFVIWTTPAGAHTDEELAAWEMEWSAQVASEGLSEALMVEWREMAERHPPEPQEAPGGPSGETVTAEPSDLDLAHSGSGMGSGGTDWRGLIRAYFPEGEVETAMRIVNCESGGNPAARNSSSGAAGLFQVMGFWASHYGRTYEDLFDPSINTEIAYRIWSEEGGWRHWACW